MSDVEQEASPEQIVCKLREAWRWPVALMLLATAGDDDLYTSNAAGLDSSSFTDLAQAVLRPPTLASEAER